MAQQPITDEERQRTYRRFADQFRASTTMPGAVEIEPRGLRELHWHSQHGRRGQYYNRGQGRMGVFGASGQRARRLPGWRCRVRAVRNGHYVENTGSSPLRFLEMFKSSYYADVSLDQWNRSDGRTNWSRRTSNRPAHAGTPSEKRRSRSCPFSRLEIQMEDGF